MIPCKPLYSLDNSRMALAWTIISPARPIGDVYRVVSSHNAVHIEIYEHPQIHNYPCFLQSSSSWLHPGWILYHAYRSPSEGINSACYDFRLGIGLEHQNYSFNRRDRKIAE